MFLFVDITQTCFISQMCKKPYSTWRFLTCFRDKAGSINNPKSLGFHFFIGKKLLYHPHGLQLTEDIKSECGFR